MGGHLSIGGLSSEEIDELSQISGFTPIQIRKLYVRFKALDKENSGTISYEEFYNIPELAMNPLISRIITLFDEKSNHRINFKDFCTTLAVFLPNGDREVKIDFAFRIYDINDDGYISREEFYTVIKLLTGDNIKEVDLYMIVDKTIQEADTLDHDGKISLKEFHLILQDQEIEEILSIKYYE